MVHKARDQLNLEIDSADCLDVEQQPDTIGDDYPRNWVPYDQWMVTGDGTKKAHAVGDTDEGAWSWSNPDNWTSFQKAHICVNEPQMDGEHLVFILDRDDDEPYTDDPDECAYIDFDDAVIDGRIHPWALDVIRMARSYACISTSGDGAHIEVLGELPDDVTQIKGEPLPEHEDFPDATIEVYDGKRIDVLSGRRIAGTPPTATRQDDLLEALSDFFLTEADRTAMAGSYRDHEFTYPASEIEQMNVGDIDAVRDAIEYVTPDDISLKSTKTETAGQRHSWDPCWGYNSKSGTTLGYDAGEDIWIWRDGDKKLNALDVVALEEGYIRSPGETLNGKDYIDALDELRSRGANIPRLEPPEQEDQFADNVDPAAFERDTTRSMTVFSAAIKNVKPDDIRLQPETVDDYKRAGERHWLHEPTGELVDTLQLVSHAEGLTERVTDRVTGRVQWIQLGHALRWRGADVPRFEQ